MFVIIVIGCSYPGNHNAVPMMCIVLAGDTWNKCILAMWITLPFSTASMSSFSYHNHSIPQMGLSFLTPHTSQVCREQSQRVVYLSNISRWLFPCQLKLNTPKSTVHYLFFIFLLYAQGSSMLGK